MNKQGNGGFQTADLKNAISKSLNYIDNLGQSVMSAYIGWRIKRLTKKADRLREETGTQIFVVKIDGKIRLMAKSEFKWKRQHGQLKRNFTAEHLKKISYYYTRT